MFFEMKKRSKKPPWLASWIIRRLSLHHHRQTALGDIEELFIQICEEDGKRTAGIWYWKQALRSIPFLINNLLYWSNAMLKNYFKFAVRNMSRNKGFSIINIAGLAVGMACCILTLMWIEYEISYNKFHENYDNLYKVAFTANDLSFHGDALPGPAAEFIKSEYPEVKNAVSFGWTRMKLSVENKSFFSSGYFAHPSFFEMFTFPFVHGSSDEALNAPLSIVITEELADKFFGTTDVVGKIFKVEDRIDFNITGVVKSIPNNSDINFEFVVPFRIAPPYLRKWDNKAARIFVQLRENSSYRDVSSKIKDVYNDHNPGTTANNFYLVPMNRIHLFALGGGGLITYIYIFSAMAVVVLLIACINFMNLSTACSEKRAKEIGIKKVVGSSRVQLMSQFLSESVLLSFISLIIAVIIANIMLLFVSNFTGRQIETVYSGTVIFGMIGIALLTGIFSGSYPAFYLSSFIPVRILKNSVFSGGQNRSSILRNSLVVTQFSFSILFIIGALIIFKQLDYIKNKDLGYRKENIMMVPVQGSLIRHCQTVKEALERNKDIESVTISNNDLTIWKSSGGIDWPGNTEKKVFDVGFNFVGWDYLKTFKMEMAEGRFFSREFPSDIKDAFVANEACIKAMGLKNPVGKKITRFPGSSFEDEGIIVGVIKDFHTESLHGAIRPFMLLVTERGSNLCISLRPGNISGTIDFIREKVLEVVPNYPFTYNFLDDSFENLYRSESITGKFILLITGIAVFISCLGLLGLASYSIQRRIKEIGIRKVFGASSAELIVLLLKDFTKWILLANLIAWPAAWYILDRWLQNFYFRTDIGIWPFLIAAAAALAVAVLTVNQQTLKAARANPVDSLRYE